MADLVGGVSEGVVFGRSMTQLTFDISRAMAKTWEPGDEIVVTKLDHDANVRPWVIAALTACAPPPSSSPAVSLNHARRAPVLANASPP